MISCFGRRARCCHRGEAEVVCHCHRPRLGWFVFCLVLWSKTSFMCNQSKRYLEDVPYFWMALRVDLGCCDGCNRESGMIRQKRSFEKEVGSRGRVATGCFERATAEGLGPSSCRRRDYLRGRFRQGGQLFVANLLGKSRRDPKFKQRSTAPDHDNHGRAPFSIRRTK